MANPRRPGAGGGLINVIDPPDLPPPIDPDELRQIQLLQEAVLVSFGSTPNPVPPFTQFKLQWNVIMPTTVLPGVSVELHLHDGVWDQLIMAQGERIIAADAESEFAIYLKTSKAARHLGSFSATVDLGTCRTIEYGAIFFTTIVVSEAERSFPAGGQLSLRGGGASVDIGINSFVVDVPLTASINNWFDPDIDVTMGFSLWAENGVVQASHDLARTNVSPGALSSILSGGCAGKVAEAVEGTSDGYLSHFVGPEIASRLREAVQKNVDETLRTLNAQSPPVPFKFYDLTLTQDGMSYRFCPNGRPRPTRPPLDDGDLRLFINGSDRG